MPTTQTKARVTKNTYVEFSIPGTDHRISLKVTSRDVGKMSAIVPEDCCAFQFYDHSTATINGRKFEARQPQNTSPVYYVGTKITPEQVEMEGNHSEVFITEMEGQLEGNGGVHIKTPSGKILHVPRGGRIIESPKNAVAIPALGHNMVNDKEVKRKIRTLLRK